MSRASRAVVATLALACPSSALVACTGDGGPGTGSGTRAAPDTTTTAATASAPAEADPCTTAESGPLRVVVVNDDGMQGPGIDVLIDNLERHVLDLEVTALAPAFDQSGSSDATTPGPVTYHRSLTSGMNEAQMVGGTPADAVLVALDDMALRPHLVVSGINPGHNFGTFAPLSGTIGAARTAARRGVPALAVSAGATFNERRFDEAADIASRWIHDNCQALITGRFQTDTVTSLNVPPCMREDLGPVVEVPRALEMPVLAEGEDIFASTCDQAGPAPVDDVAAVRAGYPAVTQIELDL